MSISNQYASPLMDKLNAAVGFLWRGGHKNSHTHKCRRPLFSAAHCFVRSGFWLGNLSFCKTSLRSKDSNEYLLELWNRILKSLIKVGCPLSDFLIFQQVESPCSCGHFKMRLTYVGPLVPEI